MAAPQLQVTHEAGPAVRLFWDDPTGGFFVESSVAVGSTALWRPVSSTPSVQGTVRSVTVAVTDAARFYRLRGGRSGTTIIETSPASGESSVAVTRETIIRFSGPLAPETRLTTEQLFAEFGGRRLLSRVDLSAHRHQVTLFYLENLPASARIRVTLNGSEVNDANGSPLDADGDGQPGGTATFSFDTLSTVAVPGTAIIGRVFASELAGPGGGSTNRPLAGVVISVDGAEETLRTTTGADGFFRLSPCPAGRFFVHIDGRTSPLSQWPDGAYYPVVGKSWDAVAGRTNNLAGGTGEVFLPLIVSNTLRPISVTGDTTVSFPLEVLERYPNLAGVEITVPANSLFSENGTRGGRVGMAPVPPDRLPGPLPPGLEFPLVITVQTDGGSNFDRPVPVRFPNPPNPLTGELQPPGAKTALWSFNHDTGQWEIQGPMTISEDGLFAISDPGVGLRAPGWHGVNPGSGGGGGGGFGNRDNDDDDDDNGGCPNPPCDDDDDPDPCKKERKLAISGDAQCGLEVLGTATQAAITVGESVPLLGCAVSIGLGIGGAVDDCIFDFNTCEKTILSQTVGTLIGCIPIVGGVGGFVYDCLYQRYDANQAYRDCLNRNRRTTNSRILHAQGAAGIPRDIFAEQAELWADAASLYALVCGNANWTVVHPADWPLAYAIFTTIQQDIQSGSAGAERIVQSERDAIMGLARPANISTAELSALIDRFDRLAAGQVPPSDFDAAAIGAAATKLKNTALELQSRGWETTFDAFFRGLTELSQEQDAVVGGGGSGGGGAPLLLPAGAVSSGGFVVRPSLYYRITDLFTGFVQQGRLGASGRFTGLILAPDRLYAVRYADPASRRTAITVFRSAPAGRTVEIPRAILVRDETPDTDQDKLPDETESIIGTDPTRADTDGDGLNDGVEVLQGANPLDGVPVATGIIASAPTPGPAVDVCGFEDLVVTANSNEGVSIFQTSEGATPIAVAQVDTPGTATAVACSAGRVVVADGNGGVIIDLSDPPAARVLHQIPLNGARSVAVAGSLAYFGAGRQVVLADVRTGSILDQRQYSARVVDDLAIAGNYLYILSSIIGVSGSHSVHKVAITEELPDPVAGIEISGADHPTFGRMHLVAGNGLVIVGAADDSAVTQVPGVEILADGESGLSLIGPPTGITAFDVAANGSGLVLFSGANASLLTDPSLGILDVSDPANTGRFLTAFHTPGSVEAVAIHNGLAYVADRSKGLQILNYLSFDALGNPPTISLSTSLKASEPAEEGREIRISANTADDVQVGSVEFYVDGVRSHRDGSFPFEHWFPAPGLAAGKTNFTVRARAIDTGGNAAWSSALTIGLTNETRPPILVSFTPATGTRFFTNTIVAVTASFNETLSPATLDAGWTLVAAGPDNQTGTADDVLLPSVVTPVNTTNYALSFSQPLPEGFYQVTATTNLADVSGNRLRQAMSWEFGIRPLVTYIGTSGTWTSDNQTGTNWSNGMVPTIDDFVEIRFPREMVVPAQIIAAYDLSMHSPIRYNWSRFNLGGHATFKQAVIIEGQTTWAGGESDVHDILTLTGSANAFLDDHTLNNRGTVIHEISANNGLLMQNSAGIRNLPGATWMHLGGNIAASGGTPPNFFENEGLLIKTGPGSSVLRFGHFVNSGTVEVREGVLEFSGGTSEFPEQHLGSYRVEAGARLALISPYNTYGPLTRVYGNGDVDIAGHTTEILFPGAFQAGGATRVVSGGIKFAGAVDTAGPWSIAGNVRFSGLAPRIAGLMVIENRGTLTVDALASMTVGGLINSNLLTVGMALEINGPAVFQGGRFRGAGRIRANGPVTFAGTIRDTVASGLGRFELAGAATCASSSVVEVHSFDFSILPGGTLDLAGAREFRLGFGAIVNEGLLEKTMPGNTRVLTGLNNRGVVSVADGGLTFENGTVLQTAGLLSLNTTGMIIRAQSNQGAFGTLDLQGGRLEGGTAIYCGLVTNRAVVSPGLPVGSLDLRVGTHPVLSVYHQSAAGQLQIDIAGPEPGVSHDVLNVTGRAVLDGILKIVIAPEYDPPLGQGFTVLTAGKVEGTFAQVLGDALVGGKRFEVEYSTSAVSLRIVSAP